MMKRALLFGILLFISSLSIAQTQIAVCPMQTTFSSMSRGYHFTAPCDFTICGLYIPDDASTGLQSVEVVRFTAGAPPAYSVTTNSFVSLFYQSYWPTNTMIPCNIQVNTGDIIGVYGCRGTNSTNSYGQAQCATTIMGNPVTLFRSGMQFNLATQQMHDIWSEVNYYVGRIFMYINCCPTADFTITSPICLGDTATATYTGSGVPPAASFDWTFAGGSPATANSIGPHDVTWATAGNHTVTLDVIQSGCTTATYTQTVTVNSNPIADAGANVSICAGASTTLTASGGTNYVWSNGITTASNTVSPVATTTYTVTVDNGSCSATDNVTVTVNPNPIVSLSATPTSICDGQSSTITASSSVTGTNFSWSNSGTGSSQTVSPGATTTYTVTGTTAGGCTGTSSITITIDPTPTITASATPSSICAGTNANITATSSVTGSSFTWDQGLGTGGTHTVSPTTTTTYTVTGTSAAGCSGTDQVTVTVYPDLNPAITASSLAVCDGQSTSLTVSNVPTGSNYIWNTTSTANPLTVTPTATTTYQVTATDPNGCTGTDDIIITVNPNPTITAVANPDSVCAGTSTNLTASSSLGSTTYAWSNGATTSNTQTVSPMVNTTYSVTGTTSAGCSGTAPVSVYVKPDATPLLTAVANTICYGDSTQINVTNTPLGTSFVWDNSSTLNPITVSPTTTTTYTVTATTIEGCTGTDNITINVNQAPQILVTNDTVCSGDMGSLLASGASTYVWSNGSTTNPLTDNPSVTTIYTVTGTDNIGCTSSAQGEIYVYDYPSLSMTSTDAHCNQDDGSVSVTASGATGNYTYSWSTSPVATTASVSNLPPGTYTVSVSDNACTTVSSVNVGNIAGPTAEFVINPTQAEINQTVQFTDMSIGASSWDWNFGDGQFASGLNPTHEYLASGIYDVWLVVEDDYSCLDSTSHRVIITSLFTIYIPNAFSPDENGINEVFMPQGVGIDQDRFIMQIYDRWGKVVFETTDINEGWNGKVNGIEIVNDKVSSAVFLYYIKVYEENTDLGHEYRGTITIIK